MIKSHVVVSDWSEVVDLCSGICNPFVVSKHRKIKLELPSKYVVELKLYDDKKYADPDTQAASRENILSNILDARPDELRSVRRQPKVRKRFLLFGRETAYIELHGKERDLDEAWIVGITVKRQDGEVVQDVTDHRTNPILIWGEAPTDFPIPV